MTGLLLSLNHSNQPTCGEIVQRSEWTVLQLSNASDAGSNAAISLPRNMPTQLRSNGYLGRVGNMSLRSKPQYALRESLKWPWNASGPVTKAGTCQVGRASWRWNQTVNPTFFFLTFTLRVERIITLTCYWRGSLLFFPGWSTANDAEQRRSRLIWSSGCGCLCRGSHSLTQWQWRNWNENGNENKICNERSCKINPTKSRCKRIVVPLWFYSTTYVQNRNS